METREAVFCNTQGSHFERTWCVGSVLGRRWRRTSAPESLTRYTPDMIIDDWVMPIFSGIELTRSAQLFKTARGNDRAPHFICDGCNPSDGIPAGQFTSVWCWNWPVGPGLLVPWSVE